MLIKKVTKNNIRFWTTAFFLSAFFFISSKADAATLQITSSAATLSPGGIATLTIVVNAEGQAINNAEARIAFPSDLLEVVSVSKSNSVFSLWVEEPAYSNPSGTISFNGGVPTPGFGGSNGTALSIVVKAKKAGQADIFFSDAAVRANDGFGTDVLTSKKGRTITIAKSSEPVVENIPTPTPAPAPTPAAAPAPSTLALQITSPTHPSQESWYKDSSPLFRWKVPKGADAVQTGIDNNASGSARVMHSPAINEKSAQDLKDGTWYFKVRARKDGTWGPTSTYIAQVDNTIPKKNDVVFSYDDQNKVLSIAADIVDETSGLDYYEIYVNDILIKKVPSSEFINGAYSMAVNTPGENTVRLVAIDRAGNSVESLAAFNVSAVESHPSESALPSTSAKQPMLISIGSFSVPALYFAILILSVLILLLFAAFEFGLHYSKLRNRFKKRAALSNGDNLKVLLTFKKRLERHLEILQRTRHERTLSKEEKEIKEAIENDLDEVDMAIDGQRAGLRLMEPTEIVR